MGMLYIKGLNITSTVQHATCTLYVTARTCKVFAKHAPAMYAHSCGSSAQHSTAGRAVQILHDCEEIWLRAAQIVVEHVSTASAASTASTSAGLAVKTGRD